LQEEEQPEQDEDEGISNGFTGYPTVGEEESMLAKVLGRAAELGTPERRKSEAPPELARDSDDDFEEQDTSRATPVGASSPVKTFSGGVHARHMPTACPSLEYLVRTSREPEN